MSTRSEDTRDMTFVVIAVILLGLAILFKGGGWIGLALYITVLILIGLFAG